MDFIATSDAPGAIGPYSQAVQHNGILYCSGQIPLDPATGELVGSTAAEQADRVLTNLRAVLEAGGASMSSVLKTTVFLADMGDFPDVNEVYARHFGDHRPARATVAVRTLPMSVLVEIDAIAGAEG
ncbi:MAG: RidA family protein [Planctomycetota bacterium]|jgi:2-iminobutanoate/2-iminopropanoate deaminase